MKAKTTKATLAKPLPEKVKVNVDLPKFIDDFCKRKAEEKLTNKASIIRQILQAHIEHETKQAA